MGYEKKNADVQEAHRDAFSDFKAVSRLAILAKLSDAAPASQSTMSAFADVRRLPRAGPSGLAAMLTEQAGLPGGD